MKIPRPISRRVETFLVGPASIRNAIAVLVAATVVTTMVGASLVLIVDSDRFDNVGDALWWALQTVTTVGYGDVTPSNGIGRFVGSLVLLYSVAFMSILTAAITTSFVEKARRERLSEEDPPGIHTVLERLDELATRLDRLDELATRLDGRDRATGDPADGGSNG